MAIDPITGEHLSIPYSETIDNFNIIDNFLQFEDGYFYKFEALIRNTDGENPLYYEGISNANKNILIKNWFVDSKKYYEKIKNEMKVLCTLTGARLYVTLDRKSNKKLIQTIFSKVNEMILETLKGTNYGVKKINKLMSSCSSLIDSSDTEMKTIMFDVDTKNSAVLEALICYIREKNQIPYILTTKKGYHVFCYKKFNLIHWDTFATSCFIDTYPGTNTETIKQLISDMTKVSMKENQLGLVYCR